VSISATDFDFEADKMRQMASGLTQNLDSQLHVTFYRHAELNSWRTKEEGRKIFEEHLYIRILAPANRLNVIERKASDEDRARFQKQFLSFVEKGESLQQGTPLDQLPTISPSQVLELKALKVDTVEQLAGMADTTVQLLGTGGQELKQRANRFLTRAASNETLSEQVRELQAQLAQLMRERMQEAAPTADLKVTTTAQTPAP
jgi:nucleotidyltransferase/DNA polymerase involved in DNA repair